MSEMEAKEAAKALLLTPAGLSETDLERVLGQVMSRQVDSADLYFQLGRQESWTLEDGIVKAGSHSQQQGVGVRALSGERTGFAYSDEILLPALTQAAAAARAIAQGGAQGSFQAWDGPSNRQLYAPIDPLESLSTGDKVSLLQQLDQEARRQDPRVKQVVISLLGTQEVVLIAASDGTLAADIRPLVRLNVSVIAEQAGRREQGSAGGGARLGYDYFLHQERALGFAREAVRQALINLEARAAPAGTMTVVLGPGWPGVLLHEAVGHGLEGDFNRKGSSAYAGRIGEKVASKYCTVVDDGTLANRRGSLTVDDEGTPGRRTVLIEDGVLQGYMQDKLNARLSGAKPTGNGRRQSYAHLPMPRMTNTYLLPGEHDPSDIISSVEKGLYAVNFGGGQVDITSGKFVFTTNEAYLIENGKVTYPVRGATLIGNGPEVMARVSMVGNDLKFDPGVGTCGKEGQRVPVGVGQPTLRIDGLTVGGTSI